jgi:uncharacterized RDD family membrane protein YckC
MTTTTAAPTPAAASAVPAVRVVEPTDVLGRRAVAFVADGALLVATGAAGLAITGAGAGLLLVLVAVLAVAAANLVALQGLTGATVGKLLCGLRIVDDRGRVPGVGPALVRTAAWLTDGFPYVAPVAAVVRATGDPDNRRLGDRWAGTYVVDREHVGRPPFALAVPADGSPPYRLRTAAPEPAPDAIGQGRTSSAALGPRRHQPGVTAGELGTAPAPPALAPAQDEGGERQPVYDRGLGAYTRWDATVGGRVMFDETARRWVPVPTPGP